MRLAICCTALLVLLAGSSPATTTSTLSAEEYIRQLELHLEADRMAFGPNMFLQDSIMAEATILKLEDMTLTVEQHLDSPPQPIPEKIGISPHTRIQIRSYDGNHNLHTVENYSVQEILLADLLPTGAVVNILFLPHSGQAKTIIIHRHK